ncbi:MAG TPA: L-aspartate oxidase [Candidatus Acidoferrales bacterium]|nr:L-aspartate oxidase [Candidatus Acidoferrales bacterium]
MSTPEVIKTDFVVVGCGVAGLRVAIELGAAGARVLVLAKSSLTDSATEWAQGGIAAALSDDDEVSLHVEDTLRAGDGLCDPAAVHVLVEEGPKYILELIEWGTEFDRAGSKLAFTREAAHSRSRILHAHGDSTGKEIARALLAKARTIPGILLRSHAVTTELVTQDGRVTGLRFLDERSNEMHDARAAAVALATGGLGQVYPETTNPAVATGDGMAIAFEAGAVLTDLEFVQFHPTALVVKGAPRFLLSEALRGEGAILRNVDLERFMKKHHEAGELAPRDVVSRAIVAEMQRTRSDFVYLDLTHLKDEYVRKRFPQIYATCQSYGVDITSDLVPVRPAAHYVMGGVKTDLEGRSSLPGLYVAGETACTGVHGANRLASNSLLEGLVFGARAGKAMLRDGKFAAKRTAAWPESARAEKNTSASQPGNAAAAAETAAALQKIRGLAWKDAGIIRNGRDLKEGLSMLAGLEPARPEVSSRPALELRHIWQLAQLIVRCALAREESRGGHYRSDFPYRDDEKFGKHSLVSRGTEVTFG